MVATMLDVSNTHPFSACAAFAVQWLECLARYDLAAAEALIDGNDLGEPLAATFPPPDGFSYCHPDRIENWTMHIYPAAGTDGLGLCVDFEVPFGEPEWRSMIVRFIVCKKGKYLEVRLSEFVPT